MAKRKIELRDLVVTRTGHTYYVTRIEGSKYGLSNTKNGEPFYWFSAKELKLHNATEEEATDEIIGEDVESETDVPREEGAEVGG